MCSVQIWHLAKVLVQFGSTKRPEYVLILVYMSAANGGTLLVPENGRKETGSWKMPREGQPFHLHIGAMNDWLKPTRRRLSSTSGRSQPLVPLSLPCHLKSFVTGFSTCLLRGKEKRLRTGKGRISGKKLVPIMKNGTRHGVWAPAKMNWSFGRYVGSGLI